MSWLRDMAALGGLAMIIYGVSRWSGPAAWVTGGAAMLLAASLLSWATRSTDKPKRG